MFKRLLCPIKNHSFFLFGARGTGKSTWLESGLGRSKPFLVDLLDADTFDTHLSDPGALGAELEALPSKTEWVIIDEVQRIPELLNTVHQYIEKRNARSSKLKFALTGSSARKLRRGSANLLAGRALVYNMFPLTHIEIAERFSLDSALHWGTLPKISSYRSDREKASYLKTYTQTYLKEEIWDEHIVRKLQPFRKFLEVAAQMNGQIINFSRIARDVGADVTTVQEYFQILEDTLLGTLLEPFDESIRKRQRTNPKFYFFDLGVQRALTKSLNIKLQPQSYTYGRAFEHFLIVEIQRLQSYFEKDYTLSYLRTKDNAEIDLIIERPGLPRALIEIKSSIRIDTSELGSFSRLAADFPKSEAYCLCQDPRPKKIGKVTVLPWQRGLEELGLT